MVSLQPLIPGGFDQDGLIPTLKDLATFWQDALIGFPEFVESNPAPLLLSLPSVSQALLASVPGFCLPDFPGSKFLSRFSALSSSH